MASESRAIGEPVWARMKGYKPWPGKIAAPTKGLKDPPKTKKHFCVFFFGTFNYSWIPEDCISQYGVKAEEDEKLVKTGPKGVKFKEAVDQIASYFADWSDAGKSDIRLPEESPADGEEKDDDSKDDGSSVVGSEELNTSETKEPKKRKSGSSTGPALKITPAKRGRPSKRESIDDEIAEIVERTNEIKEKEQQENLRVPPVILKKRKSENGSILKSPAPVIVPKAPPNKPTEYVPRPPTPPLDVNEVSDVLKSKKVAASQLKIGVLGLGNIGQGVVKNLLKSGHSVMVYNRTYSKTKEFVKAGASKATTPSDVVQACDIVFCCVATPEASKEVVFGQWGVLMGMKQGKGYVEMSTIDPDTSRDINDAITQKGGRYLEAPVCGSRSLADKGELVINACGEKSLFDQCESAFTSFGRLCMYLGENVGNASKMNLFMSMLSGSMTVALAEAMALVDASEMSHKDFVDALEATNMASPFVLEKCKTIIDGKYALETPLSHAQKDLWLALQVARQSEVPLSVTPAANSSFENARRHGYADHDAAAVYVKIRK
ncbi:putative oxidoreductase GLYR1 homolog [Galendromus occidentalis]|uniref:Cytokine-like nuclear factor N-PAC n=1 Tax=Galendromus occidentalis TaxID=34638 RepID=A0AAJ7SGR8_9ACAR|nr:putative oxidoreductase GLYR1 homolog [Galendromus occidentalis]